MTTPDESAHRLHYRASGDTVTVREGDEVESEDGIFEVRMPIATTGEVRNEGDDPLTRNELNGMARQLNERAIGVFPAHGDDTMVAAGRYSPFEKLGEWSDASIDSRDEENVLMATARMPDPETLPAATGDYRQALAILKEQAKRGIAQDASIGWRDDESFPGGVDLMEASIVGIGADWRTNSNDDAAEVVARAAVDAGADPEELVAVVRDAVGSASADADTEDSDVSMTDDDPGTDAGTTDEQTASDGETETTEHASDTDETRQSPAEIADMAEDMVMGAVENAIEEFRAELESMTDGDNEGDKDDGEDDEEDEEDGEQSADPESEQDADVDADPEPDAEQSADTEPDDETAEELRSKIDQLEADLEAVRSGDTEVDTPEEPDTDAEQDADVSDADTEDEPSDTQDAESPTQGLGDYR
jgi:hypothetical protein